MTDRDISIITSRCGCREALLLYFYHIYLVLTTKTHKIDGNNFFFYCQQIVSKIVIVSKEMRGKNTNYHFVLNHQQFRASTQLN